MRDAFTLVHSLFACLALVTAAESAGGNGEDHSARFQGPPPDRNWFAKDEMKNSFLS